MIKRISESKSLTKFIPWECKRKLKQNASEINGGITINVNLSVKNTIYVKKIVYNPATCNCESYFTCFFVNYYRINDSCYYLLLFDEISSKISFIILQKNKNSLNF